MSGAKIIAMAKKHNAQFIDLRFTDILGQAHHISIPTHGLTDDLFKDGKMFDGSSIKGGQPIEHSDLALIPIEDAYYIDPFYQDATLAVLCTVRDPSKAGDYDKDPRALALRAERYLVSTGIADTAYFGPEPEFFLFKDARWGHSMQGAFYALDSDEGEWNSGKVFEGGNTGHRPGVKGGYFPLPPVDSSQDVRSAICLALEALGISVEAHHHEVATANQCEIATRFNSLTKKADELMLLKYVVRNVAHNYGLTATFMPKPLVGDNGNGMHCHQSLAKEGQNLFAGEGYAGLSELAHYYIGGIIHHARALNAFTNPGVNSYKRLIPGFEAPVMLSYSSRNRSAAIRIPHVSTPKASRIEVRFPDPLANPYLAFSAMMMAGLDGILNKRDPGRPIEKDLYDLSAHDKQDIPTVCSSLEEALNYLESDHAFLLQGGVFSHALLEAYAALKREEIKMIREQVHPLEFALYYSL